MIKQKVIVLWLRQYFYAICNTFPFAQIRRFVKSYKKFAAPLKRLEAIAEDAELTDKSQSELKKLGELLRERCLQAVSENQENQEGEDNKGTVSLYSLHLTSQLVKVQTLYTAVLTCYIAFLLNRL